MLTLIAVVAAACSGDDSDQSAGTATDDPPSPEVVAVTASMTRTEHTARTCSGAFVRHDLDHTTTPRGEVAAMTDGTGAGVFLDDLDDDGQVDIVLPNLSGESSILWNTTTVGDAPSFERSVLETGRFRQAVAADLDADGDRDLLLSTGIGPPISFIHDGARGFERQEFRTRAVTYALAPGDLDGDGTIEVLTGSYNAELTQNRDHRALTGVDVGIALHRPNADNLTSGVEHEFLTDSSQSLAAMIVDVDGDGYDDVVVGNDLGSPDRIWLSDPDLPGSAGLTATQLFDITSLSTMSIDVADIDNDGDRDLVSTDMAALPDEPADVWAPVMSDIEQAQIDDIQKPRNVVQIAGGSSFSEQALDLGVAATGWSWSGILGDLDDDGLVDLYVVNGMQATGIFETLPNGELIEPNQVFRNTGSSGAANADGGGGFEAQPDWGLASTDGGRGMAQADLDGDGDLDIVVNNLGTPSTLWENQLCGGSSIIVEPIWNGVQNVDALATTITVDDGSIVRTRAITGARGYISTSATQGHFGLGDATSGGLKVQIRWPDGGVTELDDVAPNATLRVERSAPPSNVATSEPG